MAVRPARAIWATSPPFRMDSAILPYQARLCAALTSLSCAFLHDGQTQLVSPLFRPTCWRPGWVALSHQSAHMVRVCICGSWHTLGDLASAIRCPGVN